MLNNSGIYAIVNKTTGDYYVGSALVLRKRRSSHFHALRRGKHDSIYLQRAWTKYGPEAFYFRPFIVCRPEDLIFFEQRAIDTLKPRYNMAPNAGSNFGKKFSDAAKEKMRFAKLGRKYSAEHRAAISAGNKGKSKAKPVSAETRAKMRASRLRYLHG